MRFYETRSKTTMMLPLTEVLLYLAAGTVAMLPVVMVFYEAEKLSFWGWVFIIIYMTLLISIAAVIKYVRERRYLKALLGEEGFYELFPEEIAREERIRRWKKRFSRKEKDPWEDPEEDTWDREKFM